jgi:hypothetical protein
MTGHLERFGRGLRAAPRALRDLARSLGALIPLPTATGFTP